MARYEVKDYKTAATMFQSSAQYSPIAGYFLGLCYYHLNRPKEGDAALKVVQSKWPGSAEAKMAGEYLSRIEEVRTRKKQEEQLTSGAVIGSTDHEEQFKRISKEEWQSLPERTRIGFNRHQGHMWVRAFINGKDCKLVFDTGASACVISIADFPNVIPRSEIAKAKVIPVNRPHFVSKCREVTAEIAIQDLKRKVRVLVTSEPNVSVIGQNFFKEYTYSIDDFYIRLTKAPYLEKDEKQSRQAVAIRKSPGYKQQDPARWTLPFEKKADVMLVDIEVNGHKTKACFDTGCAGEGIVVPPQLFKQLEIQRTMDGFKAQRVVVGPIDKRFVPVRSADALPVILIGPKIFDRPYTVDQSAKCIRFDY